MPEILHGICIGIVLSPIITKVGVSVIAFIKGENK
jgi:hypothetical protein